YFVLVQIQAADAGGHIDWSPLRFWAFAMGAAPQAGDLTTAKLAATVVASLCVLVGLGRLLRLRLVGLGLSLALLAAMAAFFHWVVRDPWTGEPGQTWAEFKLCKWAFPLVVSVQVGGLGWLLRRFSRWTLLVPTAAAVLL